MSNKYIGVDIGGTKIQVGVVQNGKIIRETRFKTSATAPKEQILAELARQLEPFINDGVAGIGIGVPGLVDEQRGIVHNVQNISSWKEVHLKQYLVDYFNKPVYLTNDANAFAIGEKMYGQGKPFANLVGLALGTGLGAGIIINHDVYSGSFSSAGEFGCMPYRDQTIEDYCSGKFFTRHTSRSGAEWHKLAKLGDAEALRVFAEYGQHLGSVIKLILFSLSPEAIILGGSVSKCYQYFEQGMRESLQQFPFRIVAERLFIAPSTIDNAAILGAAGLCKMKQELTTNLHNVLS